MDKFVSHIHSFNSSPKTDSTIDVTLVIHDFELSGNGQVITEEVCNANRETLINKPILAKYYEAYDEEEKDHLGDHEVGMTINRDTGDWMVTTDTVAIGVCTKVYVSEIEGKRCLLADGVLWSDRYYNACSLLYEWYTKGIRTLSSCEYLFSNYEVKDGVQYVKSDIIYEGITLLNSEQRGRVDIVSPAYKSSHMLKFSLNKAICQDINKTNALAKEKGDGTVEETIVETVEVVEEVKVLNEDVVEPIIDTVESAVELDNTEEVVDETEGTNEEPKVEETIALSKYTELEERIAKLEMELTEEKQAKSQLSEDVVSLNTAIADLSVYKEKYDKEQYKIALNEKKEFYKEKFEKFGANELFESEEVQGLIERCLNADEEKEARLALSEMLIGAGTSFNAIAKPVEQKAVVELTTPMKDLVPKNKFKENYGFENQKF